ncbi:MAG: hypothetical protein KBB70_02555 [Candidatus Pacebacteria bacterium]|jgi:hypothetical protein|nr:hypothetical protein [Candidatus Paceibacterota bacterium]
MTEQFLQSQPEKEPGYSPNNEKVGATLNVIEKKAYTPAELEKWQQTLQEREKLANEVCLKYKKGDIFNFHLEKMQLEHESSPRYTVVLDGVEIGNFRIGIGEDGQDMIIKGIVLNKNIRNKGFGKQLYILLNNYLKKTEGLVLKQSYETSNAANTLWLSLFKDGLAEVVPENSPDGYKIPWMKNDFLPKGTKLYRFKK